MGAEHDIGPLRVRKWTGVLTVCAGYGSDGVGEVERRSRRLVVAGGQGHPQLVGPSGEVVGAQPVVLHALVDAVLGAAGEGDIGTLFGSEDLEYAGADSQVFAADALARVVDAGWAVGNADVTIVAERPRLREYRERIAESLAHLLGAGAGAVNVKAATTDGLGFTGRGEGTACLAVVLLVPR